MGLPVTNVPTNVLTKQTCLHLTRCYTCYTFLITQMLRADDWITPSQDRVCWSKECVNIQSRGCFIFYPSTFQRFYIFFKNPSWSNESSFCYLLQTRWKVFTNGNFLLNQLSYCSSLLRQLVTTFLTHIRHTRNSFADQMQKCIKPWISFGNKAWMQLILLCHLFIFLVYIDLQWLHSPWEAGYHPLDTSIWRLISYIGHCCFSDGIKERPRR